MRTVNLSEQKQQEEVSSLKAQLHAESEARLLQEGIYKEQVSTITLVLNLYLMCKATLHWFKFTPVVNSSRRCLMCLTM